MYVCPSGKNLSFTQIQKRSLIYTRHYS
jgi:hypothetical protein